MVNGGPRKVPRPKPEAFSQIFIPLASRARTRLSESDGRSNVTGY